MKLFFVLVSTLVVGVITKTADFKLPFGSTAVKDKKKLREVDVLVVGGGLCGSVASFYLNKKGVDTLLVEEKEVMGGCLVSKKDDDGFLWEEGANSFQPNEVILSVARDLGLLSELVLADSNLPRYIYFNNTLHPLPMSTKELFTTKLLSTKAKIRFVLGLLGVVAPMALGGGEESIEAFSSRHFGDEVFARIVDPFISGVYAGDPQQLSMSAALKKVFRLEEVGVTRGLIEGGIVSGRKKRHEEFLRKYPRAILDPPESELEAPTWRGYGENARPVRREKNPLPRPPPGSLGSFKRGIQSVPLKVQELLGSERVRTGHRLEKLERDCEDPSSWICSIRQGKTLNEVRAKAVLLTSPAYAAGDLIAAMATTERDRSLPEALTSLLRSIEYPPVAAVVAVYPDSAFKQKLNGFGHLIPREANIRLLGSIWASTLFKGRAPKGYSVLVNFIGGSSNPSVLCMTDDELVEQVDSDLRKVILKPTAPNPHVLGVRVWEKAIPQYNKGYLELMSEIDTKLSQLPGLYLGGNYRCGVSVGDCIDYGRTIAEKMENYLKSPDKN